MDTKMKHFPSTNPNPVLRVEKGGTLIYSNGAAGFLLMEWNVEIGN
jgi:hypothetical protein